MIGRNCEKFCSCSNECKRKFKGCKCSKGCVSCPCKVKKRECDPDICKCGAKDFDEGKCRNNQLQTNKLKVFFFHFNSNSYIYSFLNFRNYVWENPF